jgi:hypothetical protein
MKRFLCLLLLLHSVASAADNELFHPPTQIQAAGKPLDVEREGHSAPFFGDVDGDGVRDLLVGQYDRGKLRLYRNHGTNAQPLFRDFQWVKAGDELAQVPTDCCVGFTPQLVDLDGDGLSDLISGSFPGEFYFFRRLNSEKFAAAEKLTEDGEKPLNVGSASTAFAVDWNSDGKLDLILGNIKGEVYVARGGQRPLTFAPAERVSAGEKPIEAPGGDAAPVAADWDADGLLDLIVGSAEGNVHWYRNSGTAARPELEPSKQLLGESPLGWKGDEARRAGDWGLRVKPCVVDFNGDGKLDLLLGDRCGSFDGKPMQTDEEQREEQTVQDRLPGLRQAWAAAFAEYRQAQTNAEAGGEQLESLRKRVASLKDDLAHLQEIRNRYQKGYQAHGFVWVFLRK